MARIDRSKRAVGTAVRRSKPSRAASILVDQGLARGRVLDFGCGFGFDADLFGWEAYDPFYRPSPPKGPYDTIVCNLVLNVLSRNRRGEVIAEIRRLLTSDGCGYLAVPRNLPSSGKLGIHHSLQNFVVLTQEGPAGSIARARRRETKARRSSRDPAEPRATS
jgi:hypothetical protein